MSLNPELRRNLWLELTPVRLVALPVVAVLLAILSQAGHHATDAARWGSFASFGLGAAIAAAAWGVFRALRCATDELFANTWDAQRLAPHTPWGLVLGKLFGATSYTWLALATGLACFVVGRLAAGEGQPVLLPAYQVVALTVFGQAAALLISLTATMALRAVRRPGQRANALTGVIALVVASWILTPLTQLFARARREGAEPVVAWWVTMDLDAFVALSATLFAAWALVGAHRQARAELQEPVGPGAFLAFLAFLVAYLYPLRVGADRVFADPVAGLFLVTLCVMAAATHPLIVAARKDAVHVRRLAAAVRAGDGGTLWREAPLAAFPFALYLLALAGLGAFAAAKGGYAEPLHLGVGFAMLMVRDAGWLLAVFLGRLPRNPVMVACFVAALLYGLLPVLAGAFGFELGLYLLFPFGPMDKLPVLGAFLFGLPGVAIAWALAWGPLKRTLAREV